MSVFECVQYGPSLFFMDGELDLAARDRAQRQLLETAEAGGLVTIDMSNVTFMDSTGLHLLADALQTMPSGCIVPHGVNGFVAMILDQTGLTRHERLHVVPCVEDPFPDGGGLRNDGASNDVIQRLVGMKVRHKELVERTTSMRTRTTAVFAASRSIRELSRSTREEVVPARRRAA